MGIIFGLATLCILGFCITVLLKMKIEEALPVACFGLIVITYISAVFNLLGIKLLIILTIFFAGFLCFTFYRLRTEGISLYVHCKENVFTFGFLIFGVFAIGLFFFSKDALVFQWDEFSHWATTVKDMFYHDRLSIYPNSVTTFNTYPPAMALWQYLFVNFSDSYSDGVVIFAYNLYCLLMILPIASHLNAENRRQKIITIPCLIIIMFCMPYIYYSQWEGSAWRCVFIDRALSYTMAYALYQYFISKTESLIDIGNLTIKLLLSLSVLSLLKSTGNALAAFVLIPIIIDTIYKKRKKIERLPLKSIILIGISWLSTYCSWTLLLNIRDVSNKWDVSDITFSGIVDLLTGKEVWWRYEVINAFARQLKENASYTNGVLDLSYISFVFIWCLMIIIIYYIGGKRTKTVRQRYIVFGITLCLEYVIFEISLLLTYLYVFNMKTGIMLASMQRYSSDFYLGITIFLISAIWTISERSSACSRTLIVVCITVFILNIVPVGQIIKDVFYHDKALEEGYAATGFDRYMNVESKYQDIIEENDKVLVVSDFDESSMGKYVLKKCFIPAQTTYQSSGQVVVRYSNIGDLIYLESYDYVYLDLNNNDSGLLNQSNFVTKELQGLYRAELVNGQVTLTLCD